MSQVLQLIGNVATELRKEEFPRADGEPYVKVRFLLAVNRVGKRTADGQEPPPDWIPVEVWGPTALALVQFNGKGSKLAVSGRIRSEFYQAEGEEKGSLRTAVVAERIDFLTPKPKPETEDSVTAAEAPPARPVATAASERRR